MVVLIPTPSHVAQPFFCGRQVCIGDGVAFNLCGTDRGCIGKAALCQPL